jgi:hypothetical protein
LRLIAGFPAFDAAPNGEAADSTFILLLSAFGFFFSRLPFDIRNSFLPTQCRLLILGNFLPRVTPKQRSHFTSQGDQLARASLLAMSNEKVRRQIGIAAK